VALEDSSISAVSWAAIFGGAAAAVATTFVLVILGAGLGLTAVSPWRGMGASATAIGVSAIVWMVVVQWLSSAVGGYMAGRLRTKWVRLHTDEVFFRDTAHGFLVWCVATVAGAALFIGAGAITAGGVASGAGQIAGGAAQGAAQAGVERAGRPGPGLGGADSYFTDMLFRTSATSSTGTTAANDPRPEAGRILLRSVRDGQVALSPEDRTYLAQTIAARTSIPQAEAEQRVDAVVKQIAEAETKAKEAADTARKRSAQIAIVIALSMAVGAFVASVAGAMGGRLRDEY